MSSIFRQLNMVRQLLLLWVVLVFSPSALASDLPECRHDCLSQDTLYYNQQFVIYGGKFQLVKGYRGYRPYRAPSNSYRKSYTPRYKAPRASAVKIRPIKPPIKRIQAKKMSKSFNRAAFNKGGNRKAIISKFKSTSKAFGKRGIGSQRGINVKSNRGLKYSNRNKNINRQINNRSNKLYGNRTVKKNRSSIQSNKRYAARTQANKNSAKSSKRAITKKKPPKKDKAAISGYTPKNKFVHRSGLANSKSRAKEKQKAHARALKNRLAMQAIQNSKRDRPFLISRTFAKNFKQAKIPSRYGNVSKNIFVQTRNKPQKTKDIKTFASNRALFEKYKTQLRRDMSKPSVKDVRLRKIIDGLYRDNATVGSGSTAAAIRQELKTGKPVGGSWHSQKGRDSIRNLNKWLKNNPTASAGDRAAAENIILDLRNALRQ